jgi:hypothetical protein
MPWGVWIVRPDGAALGSREEVTGRIMASWPEVNWHEEPSLMDQISDAPNHPMRPLIASWSEAQRARFSRRKLRGRLVSGGLSVELFGFESEPLASIGTEIRGAGNPTPLLARLCLDNGWAIKDEASQALVDLSAGVSLQWEQFCRHRDEAIQRGASGDDRAEPNAAADRPRE